MNTTPNDDRGENILTKMGLVGLSSLQISYGKLMGHCKAIERHSDKADEILCQMERILAKVDDTIHSRSDVVIPSDPIQSNPIRSEEEMAAAAKADYAKDEHL